MTTLKPAVAGVDGSRESIAAADWALQEALLWGQPLCRQPRRTVLS